jgi:cell division protease FtsH
MPEADPVQKVSIISRGMAAGYTLSLPAEDRTLMPRKKMFAEIVGLLGGRAAEELVFDDITSGAANDIERVTELARTMVTRLGMSSELGPMVYGQKEELIFLGREISEQRDYSEAVAEKIDQEVRQLVTDAFAKAKQTLLDYRTQLDAVATRLLKSRPLTVKNLNRSSLRPSRKRVAHRTLCKTIKIRIIKMAGDRSPAIFIISFIVFLSNRK